MGEDAEFLAGTKWHLFGTLWRLRMVPPRNASNRRKEYTPSKGTITACPWLLGEMTFRPMMTGVFRKLAAKA